MALGTVRLQPNMKFDMLVNALNQNFALLENLDVNNFFRIVFRGEESINVPLIAPGTSWTYPGLAVPHKLGYSPLIIAFVTYDSPQSVGVYTTRLFGTGIANATSVSTSGVTIGYLSTEEVAANENDIFINWKISNGTGLDAPPFSAKVRYYCLTTPAE